MRAIFGFGGGAAAGTYVEALAEYLKHARLQYAADNKPWLSATIEVGDIER